VIALGAVELEAELTGDVQPDRHFLFPPRRGIASGQPPQDLPLDQLAEEVGLDGFGDRLQIIDLAPAEGLHDETTIVFEGQQVHYRFRLFETGRGGGSRRAFSSRSMVISVWRWSLTSAARLWRN